MQGILSQNYSFVVEKENNSFLVGIYGVGSEFNIRLTKKEYLDLFTVLIGEEIPSISVTLQNDIFYIEAKKYTMRLTASAIDELTGVMEQSLCDFKLQQ